MVSLRRQSHSHSSFINDSLSDWIADGGGSAGTLITLSVLGTLVLVVVLLIVAFFTQRKFVLSPDTHDAHSTPHMSRSSTNQLIADVANGLVAHIEGPHPIASPSSSSQDPSNVYLHSYEESGQFPGDLATFRPASSGLLPPALPSVDCRRSAGDGGSMVDENNYSSLKNLHPEDLEGEESHYAMVRQPDGRADEPTYSSLKYELFYLYLK